MTIHLHIDRLVLDGLPVDGKQLTELRRAIEDELIYLFARREFSPAKGYAEPTLHADDITLGSRFGLDEMGRQIGRSVFARLAASVSPSRPKPAAEAEGQFVSATPASFASPARPRPAGASTSRDRMADVPHPGIHHLPPT